MKKEKKIPVQEISQPEAQIPETASIRVTTLPRRAKDPGDKQAIIDRLLAVWLKCPRLRLGQLIVNGLQREEGDLFYKEDLDLIELLERMIR
jgi:hypothetical protein